MLEARKAARAAEAERIRQKQAYEQESSDAFRRCPNRRAQDVTKPGFSKSYAIQCLKYPDAATGSFTGETLTHRPFEVAERLGCVACIYKNDGAKFETEMSIGPDGTLSEKVVIIRMPQGTETEM